MIRVVTETDTNLVLDLVREAGIFEPHELGHIEATLEDYVRGNDELWLLGVDELWLLGVDELWLLGVDELWLLGVDEASDARAGVLYCAPEPMTERTWNVLMLLVSKSAHGRGWGRSLMNRMEQVLIERDARLVIVETSSTDAFEGARAFYPKCGFEQEARIRDFYNDGDDKIVYAKSLTT